MRQLRWLLGLLGLLLVGGVLAVVWLVPRPQRTLAGEGNDTVTHLAFAPDGQTIAATSLFNRIYLWRTADGVRLHTLETHVGGLTGIAFAPDGQLLGVTGDDQLQLWRVGDGTLVRTLTNPHDPGVFSSSDWVELMSLAFAPDGQTVAAGTAEGTVRLWRVADGTLRQTLEGPNQSAGVAHWAAALAFAPDGQTVAVTIQERRIVRLWRLADGAVIRVIKPDDYLPGSAPSEALAFAPDGQQLAVGLNDGRIALWPGAAPGAGTDPPLRVLDGHTDQVLSLAFSPNGQLLASGSRDQTARLWKPADGTPRRTWRPEFRPGLLDFAWVKSVAFAPSGTLLATGTDQVSLWSVEP